VLDVCQTEPTKHVIQCMNFVNFKSLTVIAALWNSI